jgi:CheY-like chemotaxis protein
MRILAVDDDPMVLDLLEACLTKTGHCTVVRAESAEEAIAQVTAATVPFECFLLDIMMPDRDGISLCADLRAISEYRATPIIMITASRAPKVMERAFAAGATDFLSKPLDGLEIAARVNMAGLLNDLLHREEESRHTLEELSALTSIRFEDPFEIRDVPSSMPLLALENHLLRLPQRCYQMSLFAVEIVEARSIYREVSPVQFRYQVEATAAAIAGSIVPTKSRFAYAGKGLFLGILSGRGKLNVKALRTVAAAALDSDWSPEAGGMPQPPELRTRMISARRLWSGPTACDALMSHTGRPLPDKPTEEEQRQLFAALDKRMTQKLGQAKEMNAAD